MIETHDVADFVADITDRDKKTLRRFVSAVYNWAELNNADVKLCEPRGDGNWLFRIYETDAEGRYYADIIPTQFGKGMDPEKYQARVNKKITEALIAVRKDRMVAYQRVAA